MALFVLLSKESGSTGLLPLLMQTPSGYTLPGDRAFDTVLQWGPVVREAGRAHILNPLKCVLRAKHERSWRELLQLHGLKTGSPGAESYVHEYRIPVFHLNALAVFRKERPPALVVAGKRRNRGRKLAGPLFEASESGFRELPPEEQTGFHVRRARREAAKAVYALGLASGMVRIGITPEGRTVVAGVDPAPELDDRLAELYAEAIDTYGEELERELSVERQGGGLDKAADFRHRILLGADPEFLLRRPDGKIVSASHYMEREGKVGCDAVVLSGHKVILPLAELRPSPKAEPRELVRELRRTMQMASRLIGDGSLAWLSGSMPAKGLPLGGHVHVSGVWLNERLLRVLDNYVSLPLVLAEGEAAGRRKPRYGFLGDFRRKRHGGFEYRSLPSWLASPELALVVLALVRMAALHYRELDLRPLERVEIQRAYYSGDKEELLPFVRSLWEQLELLPAYGEYQRELDAFRDRLFRLEGWNEQADFRGAWKISPIPEVSAKSFPFML